MAGSSSSRGWSEARSRVEFWPAVIGLALNALSYVGVGTIVAGRYMIGLLQLLVASMAVLLGIIALVHFESLWMLLIMAAVYLAAYAWALATSIGMVIEAARWRHS